MPRWGVCLCLTLPGVLAFGADETVKIKLQALQQQIQTISAQIDTMSGEKSAAERQLAASERAVSAARKKLQVLAQALKDKRAALAQQEEALQTLQTRIARRQDELGQWLRQQYMHGDSEVAPLISADDPNQLARDLQYLKYLGEARLQQLTALRDDLALARKVAADIQTQRDEILQAQTQQKSQTAELEILLQKRSRALAAISTALTERRRKQATLQSNAIQLQKIIDLALKRQAIRHQQQDLRAPPQRGTASPASASEDKRRPAGQLKNFAQQKGRMMPPVQGVLGAAFGDAQNQGATSWHGVFVATPLGAAVRAIAAGEVVFSDWMRGYGNLIILDHGNDYLSVYGFNEALLKNVGDRVSERQEIARAGASGSMQQTGVYFEIRYQGQPLDPLTWIEAGALQAP